MYRTNEAARQLLCVDATSQTCCERDATECGGEWRVPSATLALPPTLPAAVDSLNAPVQCRAPLCMPTDKAA